VVEEGQGQAREVKPGAPRMPPISVKRGFPRLSRRPGPTLGSSPPCPHLLSTSHPLSASPPFA
jgi:hypothetical protein